MKMKKNNGNWREVEFLDCLEKEASKNGLKIKGNDFLKKGKYPIVDQGEKYITGYTNDTSKVYKENLPVVIFGDHTRIFKFVNFPFSLGADGVKILVSKKEIDPKYFYYSLKDLKISPAGYSRHYKFLKRKKIPLPFKNNKPDLQKQKQIVSILEKVEELKQKRKKANEFLEEYLRSVFNEMFLKNEFPIKNLNEICDVRDGTHDSPKYQNKGYPLITSKNISKEKIDFEKVNLISKEDFDKINKRSKVDEGDIIMPMIGTIGNPIIIQNRTNFAIKNVALIKFKKTNISNIYIKNLLDSPYFNHLINRVNRGGTQKFISLKNIREFKIPLPPLHLQKKFASIVKKVESMKKQQKHSKNQIDNLFNALMQKAFVGELV
jgi:restriction endonuclease S subunit